MEPRSAFANKIFFPARPNPQIIKPMLQKLKSLFQQLGWVAVLMLIVAGVNSGCKSARKKEIEPYQVLASSYIEWNQTNLAPCLNSTNQTIRAAAWARVAEHEPLLIDPASKEEPYLKSLQHDDTFLPALCGLTLCNNSDENFVCLERFAELDKENALPELLLAQYHQVRSDHTKALQHLVNAVRKPFLVYHTTYDFIADRGAKFQPGAQQMMEVEFFKTTAPFRSWVEQLDQMVPSLFPANTDPRLGTALTILLYDQIATAQPVTFTMLYSCLQRNQKLLAQFQKQVEPDLQKAIASQLSTRKVLLPYLHENQDSGAAILQSLPVSNKFSHGSDFRKQLLAFIDR
ncbi:MAG: hypothetical protein ACO1QB_04955 [Verrucomicrobiales bacterium]